MEENEARTEKQPRTDTDTDVESTQSRQKKGQMKSIFLSDSDKEAILHFVKQHEELYDETRTKFKDKQRKEGLWERLAASRNLSVKTVTKWFETQHTRCQDKLQRRVLKGTTATTSVPDTSRETESEMEISMASDVTHQPSTTSPSH